MTQHRPRSRPNLGFVARMKSITLSPYLSTCITEPRYSGGGSGARLVQGCIAQPRGEPHRRPRASILRIAPELLIAKRAIGPAEEVDATQAVLGLEAGQHGPGFVDAPGQFWCSLPILGPIGTEQGFLARLVLGDGRDEVRHIDEAAPVQIVGDRVPLPGAAAHR